MARVLECMIAASQSTPFIFREITPEIIVSAYIMANFQIPAKSPSLERITNIRPWTIKAAIANPEAPERPPKDLKRETHSIKEGSVALTIIDWANKFDENTRAIHTSKYLSMISP